MEDPEEDEHVELNDPNGCKKRPDYKQNTCRLCFKHKTVYYCANCSNPKAPKLRKEKGPKGGAKHTATGYLHFCLHGGCYSKHKCGEVPRRRTKAQMTAGTKFSV